MYRDILYTVLSYKSVFLLLLIVLIRVPVLVAQTQQGVVCGKAVLAENNDPVAGVVVWFEPAERAAVTDADGFFCRALPAGQSAMSVRHLAYHGSTQAVIVVQGDTTHVHIRLAWQELELGEIRVTARSSRNTSEAGSVSVVERAAIDHLQASSLADILQLIPGQLAVNPGLSGAQQALIRQVPTTAEAARNNALGTSIILDGAPVSNNANLQQDVTILNASPGSLPPFSSVAGRGTDLRDIPADLIERVEVIRGIPSARHGDVAAGTILVQTRGGAMRPALQVRFSPTLTEASFRTGFGDGVRRRGISIASNLSAAQQDPREELQNYYRLNQQITYTQPWFSSPSTFTTITASFLGTLDERRKDPDDIRYQRERYSRDRQLRLNVQHQHTFKEENDLRLRLVYRLQQDWQDSYFQEIVTRGGLFPLSTSIRDTLAPGDFGPVEYLNQTNVQGRPVSHYARAEISGRWATTGLQGLAVAGSEIRHESNSGTGRQFDLLRPPRQNYNVGDRPRSFSEIPALIQVGLYADHRLAGKAGWRVAMLQVGLRADIIQTSGRKRTRDDLYLQPRVNASIEILPDLHLHGGYGKMTKAPTLSYLFPGTRYFDLVSFSYYAENPDERLVLLSTRLVDTNQPNLPAYTTTKYETGLQWQLRNADIFMSVFFEEIDGAYGTDRIVVPLQFDRYHAVAFPAGSPPEVDFDNPESRIFLGMVDQPANTRFVTNRGVELVTEADRMFQSPISVQLSAAWIHSRAGDTGTFVNTSPLFGATVPEFLGIYRNYDTERDRLTTSVRLIGQLPDAGLVLTVLAQTIWLDRNQPTRIQTQPIGVVDRAGNTLLWGDQQTPPDGIPDLQLQFGERFDLQESPPPLWLFNLRVSKSLGRGMQTSVYINNIFASRPAYRSVRSQTLIQRNQPIFFGFDFSAQLRRFN
ncbi:MAG: TonB-dependent receptor [Bacteroidetes bacterium]|nr:TonB-dependent receptor [Bacteroidota bacterium]